MRAQRFVPRKISEIKKNDVKVSLIGKVVKSEENFLVIEDETGETEIFSEQTVESRKLVRVFCSVIEGRLKAEAVQSLNGFDTNLYKKANELYKKAGL